MKYLGVYILGLMLSLETTGACPIQTKPGVPSGSLQDALAAVLRNVDACPQNVFELTAALQKDGLKSQPAMVANRGFHNPRLGSFSFFEMVLGPSTALQETLRPGHFYFGHFTQESNGVVELDQEPAPGKLLIELIAWDFSKEMYNFYELIGTATGGNWFYRGDSRDAYRDNQLLHLQPVPQSPKFGRSMRCSACHSSGGPIMKELAPPHNDWWTKPRPLPLEPNRPSDTVAQWIGRTEDASTFAAAVTAGMSMLEQSEPMQAFKQGLSLQEQLRPLFCTVEINLISDGEPADMGLHPLKIQSSYFSNPLLTGRNFVELNRNFYQESVRDLRFKFPETNRADADHAWLAPVKGESDLAAIESLIAQGVITREFVLDVLAVDFKQPLFSAKRCQLLKAVPKQATANWQVVLNENLQRDASPAAANLLDHLTNEQKTAAFHSAEARAYLQGLSLQTPAAVRQAVLQLESLRKAVFSDEISQNPLGQILEPGFRVIFPVR